MGERVKEIVVLRTWAKTKFAREIIDRMTESVCGAVSELEANWVVSVGVREKQVSGDDENFAKIVILFLTKFSDPASLVKKIKRLRGRGIKTYVISSMPEASKEFQYVFKSRGWVGIEPYPFNPKKVVGELNIALMATYR